MSDYPTPRKVTVTWSDIRGMTILERARAVALAAVGSAEVDALVRGVATSTLAPDELERGVLLLYAIAYQLERRLDPALTWDAMQAVDLAFDLETPPDPELEAEARAKVETAVATGLPPDAAGNLTLREAEIYVELATAAREASR